MKNWTYFLVPAFMVIVFFNQIRLANFDTLNPWKGGGFGMFASVDSPSERIIIAKGLTASNDTITISISLNDAACGPFERDIITRIKSFPNADQIQQLADDLVCCQFVESSIRKKEILKQMGKTKIKEKDQPIFRPIKRFENINQQPILIEQLDIDVLKIKYDLKKNTLYTDTLLTNIKARCYENN